jgi:uncharacterized protein YbjT (DUF2867 family)
MKSLLILGATGLVGARLLAAALADPAIKRIVAPTRRPLPAQAKLENPIVDFDALPVAASWWKADAVVCALGTTMKQAGSAAAFRQVDHDYVLAAAAAAQAAGTTVFVLNSSLGASVLAPSLYLRVKGEIERDVGKLGFASITSVRPSLLDGGQRPDWRPAETVGLLVAGLFKPLIPRRYRPVSTAAVAACMLKAAAQARPGQEVIESEAI